MPLNLVTHHDCLAHQAGPSHPERPERLHAILQAVQQPAWSARLTFHEAPLVTTEQLERVHPPEYIDRVREACARGFAQLDPDTAVVEASWHAALRAAGGAVLAARLALQAEGSAFAAVRPPGHHAEYDRAMGFCLFSNAVIAAREALTQAGARQVLIVDWDVHHGNGTQHLVERDPAIRYVSLHQWPYYPGTGAAQEKGAGNIFNVPMAPHQEPEVYVAGLTEALEEALDDWTPSLVIVSAGFDAMAGDPLAGFTLRPRDYADITARLRRTGAPIAGVLEGGYGLETLTAGVCAFLEALE
jgi:acetoin utilization deacetylase AcuC-like enzyme